MNYHYFKNQTSIRPIYLNFHQLPFNEAQALIKNILRLREFYSVYEPIFKWECYQPTSLINFDNLADAVGIKSVFYKM